MVDYSYFWSGGEPIISCFVHHWLTSMPNVKHTEYLKNTKIVHYKYPKAFIVERRPEIIVRKNDYNKNCCWRRRGWGEIFGKVQHGLKFCCEVQILSLMWEVKLGQEMKFQMLSKVWPEKSDWERQKHIFFSLPPLHSVARPPALFFSRRFMTESSRFKGSSSGHRDTQGHSASRTNQRIKSLLCGVQRQHCKVYFELRWN